MVLQEAREAAGAIASAEAPNARFLSNALLVCVDFITFNYSI